MAAVAAAAKCGQFVPPETALTSECDVALRLVFHFTKQRKIA
jgi:hypothetical protein